jgi:hypothetical protein
MAELYCNEYGWLVYARIGDYEIPHLYRHDLYGNLAGTYAIKLNWAIEGTL